MVKVDLGKAKLNLVELVEQTLVGEEVVLTKHGEALVKLEPIATEAQRPIELHRAVMSDEEAHEAMRPLSDEELGL